MSVKYLLAENLQRPFYISVKLLYFAKTLSSKAYKT